MYSAKNINMYRKNTIVMTNARSPKRNPEVGLVKQGTFYIQDSIIFKTYNITRRTV